MAEKVTEMLLKVHDLECSKCYKKVKKILCKYPEIRDQVYDEKNNTLKIKVVCCSPEKIRDKICCKGRGTIKSIEILEPPEDDRRVIVKVSTIREASDDRDKLCCEGCTIM
ncbi:hypothetical protein EZV62_002862 [Acer yangbiense]|uniref:HMA domain-containing protein n=1 Tax=Acer yangbiense TaxID=1000413 RepID=A0A5C7IYJ2_9ROSI|nr:hypothetical protein EZV62_002862 [Acer yangbiense]